MPLYDYKCASGHRFTRFVPLAQFDFAQLCECGAVAEQTIFTTLTEGEFNGPAPMFSDGTVNEDRATYFSHNVTDHGDQADGISRSPNPHNAQCGCDRCRRHLRRAPKREHAEPAKSVTYTDAIGAT